MLYITGDTHIPADIGKLGGKRFYEQKNLTKSDCVIICGDFGGLWDNGNEEKYWIKWLENKNFTTLFIDGNHENFDMLGKYPTVEKYNAQMHKISESIYHIKRGQVLEIDGVRIFAFGGSQSHDKEFRKEGKNWWREELPSQSELNTAVNNLAACEWNVDIVITHCAPTKIQQMIAPQYKSDILTDFFDEVSGKLSFKKWYFGHYHTDKSVNADYAAVFNNIISIRGEKT